MTSILDRFRLDGKVVVITGASSGLGRGFAHALSDAGAALALGARRHDSLTELADQIIASGGSVITHRTDVTDPVTAPRWPKRRSTRLDGLTF
jgi:NADP-dependent 3-hydroxy acid dehydrogenase YdfG